MSMLDSFCTSHALVLRDDTSKLLVSEAIYRSLKFKTSSDMKREPSIGIFNLGSSDITSGVVQALTDTSLYKLVKYYYGVTETEIDKFTEKMVVNTAKDLLFSSYCIFNISFPYKDYLNFIGCGLTETALTKLGIEKQANKGVFFHLIKEEYKDIFDEVTLAVNAYYAVEKVAIELSISTDEARQKILYIISNQSKTSIFKEYYKNILGEVRSVPSTHVCKIIRPYLCTEEEN